MWGLATAGERFWEGVAFSLLLSAWSSQNINRPVCGETLSPLSAGPRLAPWTAFSRRFSRSFVSLSGSLLAALSVSCNGALATAPAIRGSNLCPVPNALWLLPL